MEQNNILKQCTGTFIRKPNNKWRQQGDSRGDVTERFRIRLSGIRFTCRQKASKAGYSTPAFALIRFHTHGRSANSIRALHFLEEGRITTIWMSLTMRYRVCGRERNSALLKRRNDETYLKVESFAIRSPELCQQDTLIVNLCNKNVVSLLSYISEIKLLKRYYENTNLSA